MKQFQDCLFPRQKTLTSIDNFLQRGKKSPIHTSLIQDEVKGGVHGWTHMNVERRGTITLYGCRHDSQEKQNRFDQLEFDILVRLKAFV